MITFNYVTKDYEDAVNCSKRLTSERVQNSVFKPVLLYLRETRGYDVFDPEWGLRDSVDDIHDNSNMYFQLTNENSRNVRYYEQGIICEPDLDHPDSVLVFLLNGSLYLMDDDYKESIKMAKSLLGAPLVEVSDDSLIARVKNKIVKERKEAIIDNLIKNLDIALGMEKAPGEYRFKARAVDPELRAYAERITPDKGNSR